MPFEIIGATFISHKGLIMEKPRPILLKDLGMMYPMPSSKRKRRYGLFKCFCGKEFKAGMGDKTKSCGCLKLVGNRKTHGLSKHKLYKIWNEMMRRCYNEKATAYSYYGGSGVSVSKEWHNLNNFIKDMAPLHKEGLTLDKDKLCKEKNIYPHIYSKETCIWASRTTQSRTTRRLMSTNKTGYRGVSQRKGDNKNKFASGIKIDDKRVHLGYFNCRLAAAYAYDNYVKENNLEHTTNF